MAYGASGMSEACQLLHEAFSAMPRLRAGYSANQIPANGLYVVFETGEQAHGTERIVRVGTHTGQNNLPKRLVEHLYTPNKDRSIFRKHVGRCLLAAERNPFLEQWNLDRTTRKSREQTNHAVDMGELEKVEQRVSAYITEQFSFCVIPVEHKPDRLALEAALLCTIASCPECRPSKNWLGSHHPNPTISSGGLWNIQNLCGMPLSVFETKHTLEQLNCMVKSYQVLLIVDKANKGCFSLLASDYLQQEI